MDKTNNSNKKKHLFGRNLFTIIFVLVVGFLVCACVYSIQSYVKTYNDNKALPLMDTTESDGVTTYKYHYDEATKIKGSEFKEFNLEFVCSEYIEEENTSKATFKIITYKTNQTKKITGKVSYAVCLAADWVKFNKTSSGTFDLGTSEEKKTTKTVTLSKSGSDDWPNFPAKANTWPVKITVDKPDVYLYLSYSYTSNGETKTEYYILSYTLGEDLIPVIGGIKK